MFTPESFRPLVEEITNLYRYLDEELIVKIAKRFKTGQKLGQDNVLNWQIRKLNEIHGLNKGTVKEISKISKISELEVQRIIKEAGYQTLATTDRDIRTLIDIPEKEYTLYDSILRSYADQTFRDIQNFVNQSLITTNYGTGGVTRLYERIINETVSKVITGVETFDKALPDTIYRWAEKGLDSAFIDRGGNTWTMERYVDTVMRTTVNRTYNNLRISRMQEYGLDLVDMSSKAEARPACALCQGTRMTLNHTGYSTEYGTYKSVNEFGYGTPAGVRGINCGHMFFPAIEGSPNTQPQYDPKEAVERYNLTQKQRAMEAGLRKTKKNLKVAHALGDKERIDLYKGRVRHQQANIREFIGENDLPRKYKRERSLTPVTSRDKQAFLQDGHKLTTLEKYSKYWYNKDGTIVVTNNRTGTNHPSVPRLFKPNAVLDTESQQGKQRDRTIYDTSGTMTKQIHAGDHGRPKKHVKGHVHTYKWDADGKLIKRTMRSLTEKERKEHGDILD